ncbi:hypothetical protein QJS10_CPB14g00345 [Acorus calamus]|uniref:Uncharacterized protein n=1 Tax=Acorus calamus TaxID=4465 RepID=A0AAV9DAV3_ACOCL|nr:hypothetical protein QJS10_CPB14g00345 [Acorus calamus]
MAAAKQLSGIDGGDGFASHIAGMSKKQLHNIMSQMKGLIEQNQQQARQILIDNPSLTRALFQAQIMLGMVKPPQTVPNMQPTLPQHPQQSSHTSEPTQPLPVQAGSQGQMSSSQPQLPARQQYPSQASIPSSLPPINISRSAQHIPSTTTSQFTPSPIWSTTKSSVPYTYLKPGTTIIPRAQPFTPATTTTSAAATKAAILATFFTSVSFTDATQFELSAHSHASTASIAAHVSCSNQPSGIGTPFPQGQPPLPNMTQQFHQLTPEMEKALLQQVMSLTPEQINLLPPEQRQQVLHLQQMLR